MVFLIIIPLILLQRAAQHHGAGDKDQIRRRDDHQNGDKEHSQRRQRLLDRHGDVIRRAKDQKASEAEHPVRLRRLFAAGFAAQKRCRVRLADRHQRAQEQKREDGEIQDRRHGRGRNGDGKLHLYGAVHDIDEQQLKELSECNAQRLAAHDGNERHDDRFPCQNLCQIPLAHAENVVKTKLAVPAADKEGIRVEQEQNGERRHDKAAHAENHGHGVSAREGLEDGGGGQRQQNVRHHDHAHAGQQERQIQPFVFRDALPGKARIELVCHACSPPACRTVSASVIFW